MRKDFVGKDSERIPNSTILTINNSGTTQNETNSLDYIYEITNSQDRGESQDDYNTAKSRNIPIIVLKRVKYITIAHIAEDQIVSNLILEEKMPLLLLDMLLI